MERDKGCPMAVIFGDANTTATIDSLKEIFISQTEPRPNHRVSPP